MNMQAQETQAKQQAPPMTASKPAPYGGISPNSLENRPLHKALMLTRLPQRWPWWVVALLLAGGIGAVAALWARLAPSVARHILLSVTVFALADALVWWSAPRLGVSFGPVWGPLFLLSLPRLIVAALGALVARWLGPTSALAVVAVNLLASVALVWGALIEPRTIGLSHLALVAPGWPADAPPLRVLQISDLHVERFGRREAHLLRMVREIAPDLILLTGDYINLSNVDDPTAHADARRVLAALSAPYGVYAILGSPPPERNSAALFPGLKIHLLRDARALADLGAGRQLALLGLDCIYDLDISRAHLARLTADLPESAYRVLLYHSPELIPDAPRFGINLYLCGHTHGGQIRLPFYGAMVTSSTLGKRYEMGHYIVAGTDIYISRGIGLEGMGAPRLRFLCPPEITLCTVRGMSRREAKPIIMPSA